MPATHRAPTTDVAARPVAPARRTALAMASAVVALAAALTGCSSDDTSASDPSTAHGAAIARLTPHLPADARGVLAVDVGALLDGGSADDVAAVLAGEAGDPALVGALAPIGRLETTVDLGAQVTTALVVHPADPTRGPLVLAEVRGDTLDEVVDGATATEAGTPEGTDVEVRVDPDGTHLALVADDVLVAGSQDAVAAAVSSTAEASPEQDAPIAPYLDALDPEAPIGFAYGLAALVDDAVDGDRSLRGAIALTGSLDLDDGSISGSLAFHTANAGAFVEAYEARNRNATGGDDPLEAALSVAAPLVGDLEQVVVPLPPTPLRPTADEVRASRNLFKKLLVGMEAHDHAEDVAEGDADPWVDLVVRSEADGGDPPSPGSVFIRWRFRDRAAIEAFEAEVLPEGFSLAPTQFLESDDPDGELFVALNLYNSGGGSIVTGMRAEWDVFVTPPEGADPDAPARPRFLIFDALAEAVSADPVNLVTPAEPLSHRFEGDQVVSSVARLEDGQPVDVFRSSFPVPDPDVAPVARFTREMAIGNDYIYWGNGVYDRVLYDATTFNHDAYEVDLDQLEIRDDSPWARYLAAEPMDAVYYVNTLEYVASPLANLDSDRLDLTPEWRDEVLGFKTNGHQAGLVRAAVDQLFRGESDALVPERIANEVPSVDVHLEVTDPAGLAAALDLPEGHRLAPIAVTEGSEERHLLTLSVTEVDGAVEGTRADWIVYVDDGSGRPPHRLVVETQTAEVGVDPVAILRPPSEVAHTVDDGLVSTRLASPGGPTFEASFATAGSTDERLALDWIESGDETCSLVGICDRRYYDAETLDVPVHRPAEATVTTLATPWDEFLAADPALVLYRDNAQERAVKRWHDLRVPVPELPFSGLDDRTHAISGTGSLAGRTTDVVDSTYTYTGDAIVDGDQVTFAIDQQIDNALGEAHIFTTGELDLTTGSGTQTVVDCTGPDLMCSDIERGSTALYEVGDLDASDRDEITWRVDIAVELGGTFGTADSASSFTVRRDG